MRKSPVFLAICFLFCLSAQAAEKLQIGRFQSRAFWTPANAGEGKKAPVIILVPGSGANGPEEMMPPSYTADGKEHSLFAEFSMPFQRAGVSTLALGKPGIEFHSTWESKDFFYDRNLYVGLHWQDLVDNLADAVDFVRKQPNVDPERIYILGHSEGTQVAVDYGHRDSDIAGVILLGYAGEDLSTIVDWQLYRRVIDSWISPDVDTNQDGFASREEANAWPEFSWKWEDGVDKVSFAEIETKLRADKDNIAAWEKLKNSPLYANGIFTRGPIYNLTASLAQTVYIFTGGLDVQTRPEEALAANRACQDQKKTNCFVSIIPGLGHGFTAPKDPRHQKLLDSALGPVDPSFQLELERLGRKL